MSQYCKKKLLQTKKIDLNVQYSAELNRSQHCKKFQIIFFQIFVCIIDREEAVKRIVKRDGKTEKEAILR